MIKPLLIEIAVEELPAIPFLKELPNIEKKWETILEKNNLLCEFKFYYTPRRLVFWHREFKVSQDDSIVEMFGAPVKIAYKDGEPTGAAHGFAKKCGIELSQIETIDKGRGEVLYYKKEQKGLSAKELLPNMVEEFLNSLEFGKTMRWGSLQKSFIRPIRGLAIMLGDEIVDASMYGVVSSANSFPHRMVSSEHFDFDFAGDYFCKLDKNGVILYQDERKKLILEQMDKIQKENNFQIEIDTELLDEIVAITEYPTALVGQFDKEFLILPQEVIVNSMKEHQRYFAVYKDGKITNKFIVVSNAYTKDFSKIISGNEKVLRPRLSDAMFFWNNDIKNGLSTKGLEKITFVDGLGSLIDKIKREEIIALELANKFNITEIDLIKRAVELSKTDLLTDMVYEFTELQGLMGYYYAKEANENQKVCIAIKEQYLPNKEDGELPSSVFSSIVALSNKIDTLLGLFSVGMIPTGSRDPFALRRAAAGIVKICITHNLHLDLYSIANKVQKEYNNLDIDKIMEFFNDRLFKIFKNVNPSVIKSVLNTNDKDILNISKKIEALDTIVRSDDFKDISSTFKRVQNIIQNIDLNDINIDENLFEDKEEKELFEAYKQVVSINYNSYEEQLDKLFGLKSKLDNFFDNVFVNHENKNIKNNRQNLIGLVYKEFLNIADIKEITI